MFKIDKVKVKYAILFCFILINQSSIAQLRLAKIFSNNMVLQCDTPVSMWGWSEAGAIVTVSFNKNKYKGTCDKNGYWKVSLPSTKEGGPYNFKIKTNQDEIELTNVLFGDVWLCGGQSNMKWFVESSKDPVQEIKNANYPNIRLFDVPNRMATNLQEDFEQGSWEACTPESVTQFSAVAYFFGKDLQSKIKRPIGLISNNYNGTVIEAWTSAEGLKDMPVYKNQIDQLNSIEDLEAEKNKGETAHSKWIAEFHTADKGVIGKEYIWSKNDLDISNWPKLTLPGTWRSSGISALEELDGVMWLVKEFEIEASQIEKEVVLSLGPIDDSDKTWINGILVGETYNRFNKDRTYHVPKAVLQTGKNRIVIRVEDYVGGGGLYGSKEKLYISINDTQKSLSGVWHYQIGMIPKTPIVSNTFGPNTYPSSLYNGMIAPITDFPIKGIIFYQGEGNTYRAYEYRDLFQRWINDWRKQWKSPELPILWVQLANYKAEDTAPTDSQWAELREAQTIALQLPNTAMISAIDIGEAKSIHPLNKQEVGRRLSLAAQSEVYKIRDIKYKGGRYDEMKKNGKFIDIFFEDVYQGLKVTNKFSYVFGFSIAGADQKFYWAKAEIIRPNQIRVWSDKVENPVAVRYAWQDNPEPANVFNSEGFPLLPFRTDDWDLSTMGMVRE